jgi:hypothetical protein
MIVIQAAHHPLHRRCRQVLLETGILRQRLDHALIHGAKGVSIGLPVAGQRWQQSRGLVHPPAQQLLHEPAKCSVQQHAII